MTQHQPLDVRPLKMVRRNFNNPMVSRELNRRNQRHWVASVRQLGGKWLLADQSTRLAGSQK